MTVQTAKLFKIHVQSNLSNMDTSISRTISNAPTKVSYIFFKKNLIQTLSNTDNGH